MPFLHTVTAEFYTAYVVRKGEQFEVIFGAQYDGEAWSESYVNTRRTFKTEACALRAARAYVAENAPRAAA